MPDEDVSAEQLIVLDSESVAFIALREVKGALRRLRVLHLADVARDGDLEFLRMY